MKIKFIIGGAFAAGTSFLSAYLAKSQDVNLIKSEKNSEINFFHFTEKYSKGILWLSNYLKRKKINIDHSSLILTSDKAPKRILKYNSKMKFIFCLRDPVDRSYAHYRYTLLNGLENKQFNVSIKLENNRKKNLKGRWKEVSPYSYIYNSLYYKHLSRFYKLFPRKNILIVKSADLRNYPNKTLKKVFKFINIKFKKYELPSDFSSGSVISLKKHLDLKKKIDKEFNILVEYYRRNTNPPKKFKEEFKILKSNLTKKYKKISTNQRKYISKLFKDDLKNLNKFLNIQI